MRQLPLPEEYTTLDEAETSRRISAAKAALGSRLVVLGHHYQRDEIIQHADYRGDSYKLAQDARKHPEAEFIVFCGVHFMAESADILTPDHQKVVLPNLAAGCSMADMANIFQVRAAWRQLGEVLGWPTPANGTNRPVVAEKGASVIPVTYINSAANLKAFVGEHGGTVCTSTNAPVAVKWALDRGDKVLFFPDQHLGRNTGATLGYDPERDMVVWDPFKPLGGNTADRLKQAKFILWKGHCSVHARFTLEQALAAREAHPGVKVLVHPECDISLVREADYNGSTEYIIRMVTEAAPGTVWAVGTEINLVSRLQKENPDKTVFCLDPQICPCSTMYRIHPSFLCWALERLAAGEVVNQVVVPDDVKKWALVALERMLSLAPVAAASHVD
ncbi:MAG: quinolinate synthase NadA [Fimbriimonadaceae bacterium]|nr:quinolinate synthase NadA [Fimbriimonadaceae bacterium]QYK56127.1 MAG: quinolinate synthase NadA [Fimbriimonadaceae bacterium]